MIRFEGGSGTPEAVLLQKSKGAKKGLKFHVLDPADGAGVHAASAIPPSAAESDAGNAAAHTASERVEALAARINEIKAIEDYDEDDVLMAELKRLRGKIKLTERIAVIKAVEDYDEDGALMAELKALRTQLQSV
jgi:hypothetical protein